MLTKCTEQTVTIPEGVEVWIGKRKVTVKGPRGVLSKSFIHQDVTIAKVKNTITVTRHFGNRKAIAAVRTIISHISNLMTGVTKVSLNKI